MPANIRELLDNTKQIFMTDSAVSTLLDFERVLDELDLYAFANWKQGELVEGPTYQKYFVTCTFMWPYKKMPDPKGATFVRIRMRSKLQTGLLRASRSRQNPRRFQTWYQGASHDKKSHMVG